VDDGKWLVDGWLAGIYHRNNQKKGSILTTGICNQYCV
jgi:hypothetical protein